MHHAWLTERKILGIRSGLISTWLGLYEEQDALTKASQHQYQLCGIVIVDAESACLAADANFRSLRHESVRSPTWVQDFRKQ